MGCGASTTTGRSTEKIKEFKDSEFQDQEQVDHHSVIEIMDQNRRLPSRNANLNPPGNASASANLASNQSRTVNPNANHNPNFFYNEEYFIQQAMQESLQDNRGRNNAQNDEELFDQIIKDTIVMSRKEYDDIGRKKIEEEIRLIKDDPVAMKKKLENLLSEERVKKNGKKLPPLQGINRKMNKGNVQDLSLIKAPILQMGKVNRDDDVVQKKTSRNLNETESEIDIKESFNWRKDDKAPSYNPQLLQKQAQPTEEVLFSMQSNEFVDEGHNFTRHNNDRTNDDEFNNLMRDLADDEPTKNNIKKPNASNFANQTKVVHQQRNVQVEYRKNSNDSFDELMDGFNQSGKPKFEPKQQPRHNANNEFDDFDFVL